jgi:hypothetical protein
MVDPLRQEPDKADRPQSPVPSGCGKSGLSLRCTPWHRRPNYDLRRAPCDHPDFTSNAPAEDLFRGSLDRYSAIGSSWSGAGTEKIRTTLTTRS